MFPEGLTGQTKALICLFSALAGVSCLLRWRGTLAWALAALTLILLYPCLIYEDSYSTYASIYDGDIEQAVSASLLTHAQAESGDLGQFRLPTRPPSHASEYWFRGQAWMFPTWYLSIAATYCWS